MTTLTLEQGLAATIRRELKKRRLSQRTVATHVGVNQASISMLVTGKRGIHAFKLYSALAEVFDMPLSQLIREAEITAGQWPPPHKSVPRINPPVDESLRLPRPPGY